MKYTPFGETRYVNGSTPTDRRSTGQREETGLGSLYDYNARMYSPVLGRFLSADTMVPDGSDPQSWNPYSYGLNNPIKYQDPSGHCSVEWDDDKCSPRPESLIEIYQAYYNIHYNPLVLNDHVYYFFKQNPGYDLTPYQDSIIVDYGGAVNAQFLVALDQAAKHPENEKLRKAVDDLVPLVIGVGIMMMDGSPQDPDNLAGLGYNAARQVGSNIALPFGNGPLRRQIEADIAGIDAGNPPPGLRQGGTKNANGEYVPGLFLNKKGDLPIQPEGYYTEWDVWPGSGSRGAERLVFGRGGEVYYTNNHYQRESFVRIR